MGRTKSLQPGYQLSQQHFDLNDNMLVYPAPILSVCICREHQSSERISSKWSEWSYTLWKQSISLMVRNKILQYIIQDFRNKQVIKTYWIFWLMNKSLPSLVTVRWGADKAWRKNKQNANTKNAISSVFNSQFTHNSFLYLNRKFCPRTI